MNTISVILTTYNAPLWLEKVLWGYRFQSDRQFEIVVADDGSTFDTTLLINRFRKSTGLNIKHVWQEDRGFRKSEILNKSILAASGTYLIFSDGDCIPRRDFVAQHRKMAAPGYFLSGGVVRLPLALSERIDVNDIFSGRATDPRWLTANGLPRNRKTKLLTRFEPLGYLWDRVTTTRATWNGHDASGWKRDLLRINGFDQRLGYGGMDRELGERLVNAGVRPRQIRHRVACVHLDHGRPYECRETIESNCQIRRQTVAAAADLDFVWYLLQPRGGAALRGGCRLRVAPQGRVGATENRSLLFLPPPRAVAVTVLVACIGTITGMHELAGWPQIFPSLRSGRIFLSHRQTW